MASCLFETRCQILPSLGAKQLGRLLSLRSAFLFLVKRVNATLEQPIAVSSLFSSSPHDPTMRQKRVLLSIHTPPTPARALLCIKVALRVVASWIKMILHSTTLLLIVEKFPKQGSSTDTRVPLVQD
ncbi:hypothetical protein HD806DRAFT_70961 [Xylariaceae sp. AK1471]|nr:hypothetical protein HD806DRAFT_70961 [Xylariaceae sp. AK1471]